MEGYGVVAEGKRKRKWKFMIANVMNETEDAS